MKNLNASPELGLNQPHPMDLSKIPGWGADLSALRRPGVPREWAAGDTGAHWEEPEQQRADVKILWSIERPMITPVFGTTCPPRLLSGVLRTRAYRLGEDKKRRWLTLMLADRVDVWEHRIEEFFLGRRNLQGRRFPNPFNWILAAGVIAVACKLSSRSAAEA